MRSFYFGLLFSGAAAFAQISNLPSSPGLLNTQPASNAPATPSSNGAPIGPMSVVATINGKPFTAAEVDAIIATFPKAQRQNFQRQPKQFLEEWAQMQEILKAATQDKVAEASPYKEQLEDLERQHDLMKKQILYNAELSQRANAIPVTSTAIREYYEKNPERYRESKVKVIYIPFTAGASDKTKNVLSQADAKAKAQELMAKARGNADFAALAKENSEDSTASRGGDVPTPIRHNTNTVSPEIRSAILAAKVNDVVGPFEKDGGFFIYKITSLEVTPLERVHDDIFRDIQNTGLIAWLQKVRGEVNVKIENPTYFQR